MKSLFDKLQALAQDPTVQIALGVCALVYCLTWCRIFAKVGRNGALGFLMLIPGVNLIMQLSLAFSRWPLEQEVRELRGVRSAVRRVDDRRLRRAA